MCGSFPFSELLSTQKWDALSCKTIIPGQPVADLESYMSSLEKKQLSLEKMVGKLAGQTDPAAQKPFDCIIALPRNKSHVAYNPCLPMHSST